jgi:hypothetical protein
VIGTVADKSGQVPIVVERITPRGQPDPIWLFSSQTLEAVPELYEEILQSRSRALLPRFLTHNHVGGIPLFEWLALLAGLPAIFLVTGLLNRLLKPVVRLFWRRVLRNPNPFNRDPMPRPARLLLLAVATRWLLTVLPLSLLLRQFWANVAILLTITSLAWLLMVLGGDVETILLRRLPSANTAAIALLRVGRRVVDVLVVFTALFAVLRHFGIDPTPALAGLGVGGIAVALAAQKTLENVIAGAVADLRSGGEGRRLPQDRRDRRHGRSHRPAVHPHPHARTNGRQRPQQPDREREPRNVVGARQVLVPPGRGPPLRDHRRPDADRARRASAACWRGIHPSRARPSVSASCGSAPPRWTSKYSPTSWRATGRTSSSCRKACCSASPRSWQRPAQSSPSRRKRSTSRTRSARLGLGLRRGLRPGLETPAERQVKIDALHPLFGLRAQQRRPAWS